MDIPLMTMRFHELDKVISKDRGCFMSENLFERCEEISMEWVNACFTMANKFIEYRMIKETT
jgi:hypothetical protein